MRLDKYVAVAAGVSRSTAAALIKNGRVTETDSGVFLDGVLLSYREHVYIVMNKPAGLVCENGRPDSVFSLLPEKIRRRKGLSVCGRLDRDTEGLLFISDDGDFVHRIISPKKHLGKRYFVRLSVPAKETDITLFADGLAIDGGDICKPAKLERTDNPCEVYVTITEGMYHQIKRMFHAVGNGVLYLKRVQTGSLTLPEDLRTGSFRELTESEIALIFDGKTG
jgi:16S rRNA pseudouridine516 synthase